MNFKKIIAYPLAQVSFYLGHYLSIPMYDRDWAFLYPAYNTLMGWSCELSLWADLGLWRRQKDDD